MTLQKQQPRSADQATREVTLNLPLYVFETFDRLTRLKTPNPYAPKTLKELLERKAVEWCRPQPRSLTGADTFGDSKVGKRTMDEDSAFLVVMDYPGAEKGGMPRTFYRHLDKLQDISRVQKSVYHVTSVSALRRLVDLGRGCGFLVQAFKVSRSCDNLKVNGAGNEVLTSSALGKGLVTSSVTKPWKNTRECVVQR